jgi:NAD(P)-dependent dehydrogenase (short-subunit alcohol dehydrogenase family)
MTAPAQKPVCLVTGATDGVGKVTALELAKRGFRVVMAARNAIKAERAQREIALAAGTSDVDYLVADLASLRQVRRLAEAFRERYAALDVLINNAGVVLPARTVTEDGYETTYQVNYLSHFLLTQLLLDRLERSPQGRIVNLSSSIHSIARFDADNLQSEKHFSALAAYAASKLFMLMFTEALATRLTGTRVTANAVHPGVVRTPMMRRMPGMLRVVTLLAMPFSVSPEKGAETSVHLASSEDVRAITGRYFVGSKPATAKNKYDTEANRNLLWDLSMKAIGVGGARLAPRASAAS